MKKIRYTRKLQQVGTQLVPLEEFKKRKETESTKLKVLLTQQSTCVSINEDENRTFAELEASEWIKREGWKL